MFAVQLAGGINGQAGDRCQGQNSSEPGPEARKAELPQHGRRQVYRAEKTDRSACGDGIQQDLQAKKMQVVPEPAAPRYDGDCHQEKGNGAEVGQNNMGHVRGPADGGQENNAD